MLEYEKTGVLTVKDIETPSRKQLKRGVAILECVQEIPCNPCVDACPFNAISMRDINAPPEIDFDKCTGCGRCIDICPGLAIFVVKIRDDGRALITLPCEFLPIPKVGDRVKALNREGNNRDTAVVKKVVKRGKTLVITVEVDEGLAMEVRNIQVNNP